jgi:hypothetical protein
MDKHSDVSWMTSAALALGAAKATDLLKNVLVGAGFTNIPPTAKSVAATTLAVVGSVSLERGGKRRALTACAAAGLASLLHSSERTIRSRGDLERMSVMQIHEQMRRRKS